jgi:hypothetical protein
MSQLS